MAHPHLLAALQLIDTSLIKAGRLFSHFASICLLGMLVLTAATILLRPFDMVSYWMFPWMMVLFVWLSFFGMFAAMVFARDVRIDFVAKRLGRFGMPATRIIGQITIFSVVFLLLREIPTVLATQTGKIDGVLLPWGGELPRVLLSVPLALSSAFILLAVLVDVFKMALGLHEFSVPLDEASSSPAVSAKESV